MNPNKIISTGAERCMYKLEKARETAESATEALLKYEKQHSVSIMECPTSPDMFLAQEKILRYKISPENINSIEESFGFAKALRACREKFGHEGVTSVVKNFIKTDEFIKSTLLKMFNVSDEETKTVLLALAQKMAKKS